jgi:uncharacterized damage-inducible protein DinB
VLDRDYLVLMSEYNAWMNAKLYDVCATLSDEERKRDRGAFFKSIHGTLQHLVWGDRAWLIRFLKWDLPVGKPDEQLFESFEELRAERVRLDGVIFDWVKNMPDAELEKQFPFKSVVYKKMMQMPMWLLLVQMFNHQTHHRGQLTTLLSQLGIDPGPTDIPVSPFAQKMLVTDV